MSMTGGKLTFSMKMTKKKTSSSSKKPTSTSNDLVAASDGFSGFEDEDDVDQLDRNSDLPKEPLVIPVQKDARQSLQEKARQRRQINQIYSSQNHKMERPSQNPILLTTVSHGVDKVDNLEQDQAAINALQAEAEGGISNENSKSSKMVIEGTENTFQRDGAGKDTETEQFQQDLERLAPELSVDSNVYRQVPISQFGAAMLRGMGWAGSVDKSDKDPNLPRPSRLGLGATPKLLDAPTHGGSRRPRRQDQVQRDEKRKQLQEEYERQRQQQMKLDKQRTLQVGSIVHVQNSNITKRHRGRAIIRQWQGVPGLNMVLVQFEGDNEPTKVKKGDVQLIERSDLQKDPFEEPLHRGKSQPTVEYLGELKNQSKREESNKEQGAYREEIVNRRDRHQDAGEPGQRLSRLSEKGKDERASREHDDGQKRRRVGNGDGRRPDHGKWDDNGESYEDSKRRRRRDKDDGNLNDHQSKRRKRSRSNEGLEVDRDRRSIPSTWLTPHIRVRVISSKMGKRYYKEKGVVIDVTANGKATLNMNNGQILHVPERYLETALPKVGGNACILAGNHRYAKGRLLERDSRANRGSVQVFEDMTIVTTSLDDMAEWCAPLDEDLM